MTDRSVTRRGGEPLARRVVTRATRAPSARRARATLRTLRYFAAEVSAIFAATWRRSLQLRVTVSTLALSTGVVIVLGLVLQTQIADRLVQGKLAAARSQMESATAVLERELSGVNPNDENVLSDLNKALDRLSVSTLTDQPRTENAGDYRAVLTTGESVGGLPATAGELNTLPMDLRRAVQGGVLAFEFRTVNGVPMVIYGQPVRTAGRDLQFYLLFSLTGEQRTLELVQSTLIAGGLVLILLLAAVASLVTRQVVRPVQQAAEVAERFADGHLEERMPVKGDDEVARLAESYNEMASSIQAQIRQLEEFGALQRRFTSDVSHELRTPLTTVRMAADVIYASRDELLPALRRSSELLVDELDRFEALLADLLEISRLDAGMAELGAERTDMHAVVQRAVEAVRGLAEESNTELRLEVPAGVYAEIDPRRVERIVRNLVANAIDHGEGNPVLIRLGCDERSVAVLVRDRGLGLRPGEAGLVFNRFWRADSSRQRRSGGTGLGLSISLEDARLHGGWLQAWGEPGKGAAFRLTLPRQAGGELDGSPLPLVPTEEPLDGVAGLPGGSGDVAPGSDSVATVTEIGFAGNSSAGNTSVGNTSEGNSPVGESSGVSWTPADSDDVVGNSSHGTSSDGNNSGWESSDEHSSAVNSPGGNGPGSSSSPANSSGLNSSGGNTSAGDSPAGNSSAGNRPDGNTSGGNTFSGNSSAGNSSGLNSSGGDTSAEDSPEGDTSRGNSSAGNSSGVNSSGGNTSAGDSSDANSSGGNSSGGNSSAGGSSGGNSSGGNSSAGGSSGGNSSDRDGWTAADSSVGDSSVGNSSGGGPGEPR